MPKQTKLSVTSDTSLLELAAFKKELEQQIAEAQEKVKAIKGELEDRYLERAQDKLRKQGKDFGNVTVEDLSLIQI